MLNTKNFSRLSVIHAPKIFEKIGLPTKQYDKFCKDNGLYDVSVLAASNGMDDLEMQENIEERFR
jgi:hypothetical protein